MNTEQLFCAARRIVNYADQRDARTKALEQLRFDLKNGLASAEGARQLGELNKIPDNIFEFAEALEDLKAAL